MDDVDQAGRSWDPALFKDEWSEEDVEPTIRI